MRMWIVDVFVRSGVRSGTSSTTSLSAGRAPLPQGNPLAVVECALDTLTTAEMQAIAFEFDFSETTFVAPAPEGGAWPTRIFTPAREIPFAGHPTLGTAHVVRTAIAPGHQRVVLRLPVGDVPVQPDTSGRGWLTAPPIALTHRPDPGAIAQAWGFNPAWIDPHFPVVDYDAGPKPTIVPLRSAKLIEDFPPPTSGPGTLYLIAPDTAEDQLEDFDATGAVRVRLFAPNHGVPEDPATGSAACCLGRYLLDFDYLGPARPEIVTVHQGREMGRPSLLLLRAQRTPAGDLIEVGGSVREFARGEILERRA